MSALPYLSLSFFPPFRPRERAEYSKSCPLFLPSPYGKSRRLSEVPKQTRLELGPFRKDPKCARRWKAPSTSALRPRAVPSVGGVGQWLRQWRRWRREAAAASTSPKTGATFKEGAESPRSPASCCWRTPTLRRGLTKRSGGAGKQVRTRLRPRSGEERAVPPSLGRACVCFLLT